LGFYFKGVEVGVEGRLFSPFSVLEKKNPFFFFLGRGNLPLF